VVAAVGDVELEGVTSSCIPAVLPTSPVCAVLDGHPRHLPVIASGFDETESGGERPMTGQQRQRGQRIGGPPHDPLEQVRNVLGDLHRQPQAGQVGEVPPGDVAEIDVGDLIPQPRSRPGSDGGQTWPTSGSC